ncbi:MAG: phosphate ABC transporter permease [uncultured bacterium]|nr:MAG: phosphate ABC transporter permease [uncultured bacterium]
MKRWFEQGIVLFSWGSMFLLLAALSLVLGYLMYRGGGSIGTGLVFGNIPPCDALLLRRQVFNGLFPAIAGTFALVLLAVGLAVPVGLAAGIYLAEYCRGRIRQLLGVLFDTLAGLPSIVVGLAGFSLTIVLHRLLPGRLGPCLLISALAMSFLILPYLISSTQLALESVAPSLLSTSLCRKTVLLR